MGRGAGWPRSNTNVKADASSRMMTANAMMILRCIRPFRSLAATFCDDAREINPLHSSLLHCIYEMSRRRCYDDGARGGQDETNGVWNGVGGGCVHRRAFGDGAGGAGAAAACIGAEH